MGLNAMRKIYGGVKGYDIVAEWQLINNVLQEEKRQAEEYGHISFWEIFRGADLVSRDTPETQHRIKPADLVPGSHY
jgi:hypothetical protein